MQSVEFLRSRADQGVQPHLLAVMPWLSVSPGRVAVSRMPQTAQLTDPPGGLR